MLRAQDFVKACMCVDPSARLTAKQALQHGWFAPRADDHQSVAIGASKAAMAALERRVASLTVTDAPKRVIRWFGRLAGRKRAISPSKQLFWELKMGMPAGISAQEQEGKVAPLNGGASAGATTDASSAGTSTEVRASDARSSNEVNGTKDPAAGSSARQPRKRAPAEGTTLVPTDQDSFVEVSVPQAHCPQARNPRAC